MTQPFIHPGFGPSRSSFALVLENLSFAYPGQAQTVQGVDLRLGLGERLGVIGPNGAGKTTLFLLFCGILSPTQGRVEVLGEPIVPGQFRPDLGFVFQNPDDQLFCSSVWDEVAFGLHNLGVSPPALTRRVNRALAFTGIEHLRHSPPHHLSGGQKRMVAIASVLALTPRLIIYDEPSAYLDIQTRRRLIQLLQASEETLLVSSHDLELIREVCDRVMIVDEGHIVAQGLTDGIMADRALMEAHHLEVPPSLNLLTGKKV